MLTKLFDQNKIEAQATAFIVLFWSKTEKTPNLTQQIFHATNTIRFFGSRIAKELAAQELSFLAKTNADS